MVYTCFLVVLFIHPQVFFYRSTFLWYPSKRNIDKWGNVLRKRVQDNEGYRKCAMWEMAEKSNTQQQARSVSYLTSFTWRNITLMSANSVAQSGPTLCNPVNHSTPGLPVHHQLPEFTETHAHQVGDAIQPPHPLSSPSPPAPNPSQHQGLFQWVNSPHEVAKVLEFQLQHQSFQWTPRTDLL